MNWYERNLAVIRKRDPALAEKISAYQDEPFNIEVVESKVAGIPTLKIKKDGREAFLHSPYNPLAENERLAKRMTGGEEDEVIVIGFGLGYHIEQFLKKYDNNKRLLMIEPEILLFKKALELRDLSFILEHESLVLSVGDDKLALERKFSMFFNIGKLDKVDIQVLPVYPRIFAASYERVREICINAFKYVRMGENTILFFSGLWPENVFRNLPETAVSPGVNALFGKTPERPGIIISAGPSLGKNRHLLREAKGKAVLICVDTALRSLLKENIKPDLVVALDGSELNYRHFEGIDVEDVPMVFFPTTHYKIIENYRSPKIVVNDHVPVSQWVMNYLDKKGELSYGGSVATAAFDLAVRMGCNPIIFVGQDLAYPGGKSHADGTLFESRVIKDDGARNKMYVEDIYGNPVLTDTSLYSFLQWFEHAIDARKGERLFIDATEGGAKIRGTKIMTLREVIDEHLSETFDPGKIISDTIKAYSPPDTGALADALKEAVEDLAEIGRLSRKGAEYAGELLKAYTAKKMNNAKVAKLIRKMERIDKQIKEKENNQLLNIILQRVLLAVMKGPLAKATEDETEREKGIRVARRSLLLYQGIEGAAKTMGGYIGSAFKDLESYERKNGLLNTSR
ncbi:motility associated factor glycosyltransferase family protein [Thermincola ferriacetica]